MNIPITTVQPSECVSYKSVNKAMQLNQFDNESRMQISAANINKHRKTPFSNHKRVCVCEWIYARTDS